MKAFRPYLLVLSLVGSMACIAGDMEHHDSSLASLEFGSPRVTVMTRNMYIGTNVGAIIGGSLDPASALADFMASDVDGRIRAQAAEIYFGGVELVGLQEVARVSVSSATDGSILQVIDFEQILHAHLAGIDAQVADFMARFGLPHFPQTYRTVASVENADFTLPLNATKAVNLVDRDVIIARDNIEIEDSASGNFPAEISVPVTIGDQVHPLLRGWASVDFNVDGVSARFVNTHLEAFSADARAAQSQALLAIQRDYPGPILAVGDFNSSSTSSVPSEAYNQMLGAGFADVWLEHHSDEYGATFAVTPDLSQLGERIDFIFSRGASELVYTYPTGYFALDSGVTPSDHAGVVARIELTEVPGAQGPEAIE